MAIKGESYECDTMYPGFIKEAKQVGNQAAVQTFNYALEAETGYAKLYTTAKNNLASWKQANRPLYVCPCHKSKFTPDGKALGKPATEALQTYTAKLEGGDVLVRIKVV